MAQSAAADTLRSMALPATFSAYGCKLLSDHFEQIRRCVALCTLEQVWHRVNENSNSIGNLLLHLRGNVTQWILAGLGGRPFDRDRPAEFAQREALPVGPMIEALERTVRDAAAVITGLDEAALLRQYEIQRYRVTGVEAVFHVVEHFSFHTGQIVTMTKAMLNRDLSRFDTQGRPLAAGHSGAP